MKQMFKRHGRLKVARLCIVDNIFIKCKRLDRGGQGRQGSKYISEDCIYFMRVPTFRMMLDRTYLYKDGIIFCRVHF